MIYRCLRPVRFAKRGEGGGERREGSGGRIRLQLHDPCLKVRGRSRPWIARHARRTLSKNESPASSRIPTSCRTNVDRVSPNVSRLRMHASNIDEVSKSRIANELGRREEKEREIEKDSR